MAGKKRGGAGHAKPPAAQSNEQADSAQHIRVVRLRYAGKRWEVPVFFKAYLAWKEEDAENDGESSSSCSDHDDDDDNKNKNKQQNAQSMMTALSTVVLSKMVVADRIFSNSYKRETCRDKDLKLTFPGKTFDEIASFILRRGEIVEVERDRLQEKKHFNALLNQVILLCQFFIFHKFTGELFEVGTSAASAGEGEEASSSATAESTEQTTAGADALEFSSAIKNHLPMVRNLLSLAPELQLQPQQQQQQKASSTTSNTNNETSQNVVTDDEMKLRPVWRIASWLARQIVVDSNLSDVASFVAPVLVPIRFESKRETPAEKTEDEEQQLLQASFAKLKALVETDWCGLMKLLPKIEIFEEKASEEKNETETEEQQQEEQKQPTPVRRIVQVQCLVAAHHPSASSLVGGNEQQMLRLGSWPSVISKSIESFNKTTAGGHQISWKVMLEEVKRFDPMTNPELLDMFVKDPFDLTITLPLSGCLMGDEPITAGSAADKNKNSKAAAGTSSSPSTNNVHEAEKMSQRQSSTSSATNNSKQGKQSNKKQQQQRNANKNDDDHVNNNQDDDGAHSSDDDKQQQQKKVDKYDAMTHRDLQQLCKKKGFSTGGSKADMLSRIRSS